MSDEKEIHTEATLTARLRQRYPSAAYAFFEQVRNGTGYVRRVTRTADAVAMGLWPSRGLTLEGFEIKVSRSDWKHELAAPEKADEVLGYCDLTWVVAPPGVVDDGELPPLWGLLEPRGKDGLRAKVVATKNPLRKDLDRVMFASLMRNAQGYIDREIRSDERAVAIKKEAEAAALRHHEYAIRHAEDRLKELRAVVDRFEQASGLCIQTDYAFEAGRIGDAVRLVMGSGFDANLLVRLRSLHKALGDALPTVEALMAKPVDKATTTT